MYCTRARRCSRILVNAQCFPPKNQARHSFRRSITRRLMREGGLHTLRECWTLKTCKREVLEGYAVWAVGNSVTVLKYRSQGYVKECIEENGEGLMYKHGTMGEIKRERLVSLLTVWAHNWTRYLLLQSLTWHQSTSLSSSTNESNVKTGTVYMQFSYRAFYSCCIKAALQRLR